MPAHGGKDRLIGGGEAAQERRISAPPVLPGHGGYAQKAWHEHRLNLLVPRGEFRPEGALNPDDVVGQCRFVPGHRVPGHGILQRDEGSSTPDGVPGPIETQDTLPLILALYWGRTTRVGMLAGVLAGQVAYLAHVFVSGLPATYLTWDFALYGMLLSLVLTAGVSLVTTAAPEERSAVYSVRAD